MGRTHGVHAEPMTLGVKLALWHAELQRNRTRLLRARDVVIYRDGNGLLTFNRIQTVERDRLTSQSGAVIQRKDILGKVVWRFDPGDAVKQLMRQKQAGRSTESK